MKPEDFLKENEFIGDDAHHMHKSHQHHMLREECYHSAANAIKLHQLLGQLPEGHELDAWAAEKISLANDYLKTVTEWLEYDVMGGTNEAMMSGGMEAFSMESAERKYAELLGESEPSLAEGKDTYNFDIEDIKRLEKIKDLATLKTQAFDLISKPSAKPMKPEKVAWFSGALEKMDSPIKVIKLMYDLYLSGQGHAVIGSRNSMASNSYRAKFGEQAVAEGQADQVKKIVKKNGKPVGEIGTDPEASPGNGNWYVKHYASGYDVVGFDNAEEALAELKHCMKQAVAEGHDEESINQQIAKIFARYANALSKLAGQDGYSKDDIIDLQQTAKAFYHSMELGLKEWRLLHDLIQNPPTTEVMDDLGINLRQEYNTLAGQVNKKQGVAEGHADQQRKVFKKNGKPVGEVGIDRESSPGVGQYYMKHYASGKDLSGYDSYEEAVAELKHCLKQGVAEGEITKTAAGTKHRSTSAYGGTEKDTDHLRTLDKHSTNRIDRALDVKYNREKKFSPGLDLGETTTAGGVSTVPATGGGTLFGGSYQNPSNPFRKKSAKKESVIKR
jgi:hypothetical protein